MTSAMKFRQALCGPKMIVAPGAPDSLTARLVQTAGFPAVYMTGFGATATRLGMPDLSLLTQSEMADHARSMVRAVGIPIVADADTGYGGPINIRRAVQEYIQAGVAAVHLEDQVFPKRCGQVAGLRLIDPVDAALRLRAAIAARGDHPLVIIGRTDALSVSGSAEAIARGKRYLDAGVDLVFVDGIKTVAEVESVARGLEGPKVVSIVDGTDAARLTSTDLQDMGFKLALYAVTTLFAATEAARSALAHLSASGTPNGGPPSMTYSDFAKLVELEEQQDFASRFEQ